MIFPIGDDQITGGYKPYFSYSLILINVIIFLFEVSLSQTANTTFITTYGTIPFEITHGQDYFTLVTNMFLHGGWMHLIGNMVFLWIFGDNIEATIGNLPFIVFYLMGGILASLAHVYSDVDSQIVSLGASGAIAAVMGAYLVMFPKSKIKMFVFILFRSFKIPAFLFLGFWFLQQMYAGVGSMGGPDTEEGGIAWWAHIGGFVFGLVAGYIAKQNYLDSSPKLIPSKKEPNVRKNPFSNRSDDDFV